MIQELWAPALEVKYFPRGASMFTQTPANLPEAKDESVMGGGYACVCVYMSVYV